MSPVRRCLRGWLAVLALGVIGAGAAAADESGQSCRHGDRGRLLGFERVASHPTAVDARAYFDSWVEFYRDFYGFPQPSDAFRRPFAATVPGLFDMQHFFDDVLASLPPTSRELLRPSFYADVSTDPNNPLRVRLRQNAVDQWRPDAPIRVYHSPDDEEVSFEDALVSVHRLRNRGADVSVRTLPGFDHVNSWVQAMPRAVRYFKTLD
jgi:hypothetical protein